ncbi:hypothetical protein ABZ915_25435 [Streptomyces sp. NPDC046915]|uniref:hypothetical protein n=1 Tax=Streptomyces sp. NPDC046915 TaxID=3155257 RepID=UPI0033D0088D
MKTAIRLGVAATALLGVITASPAATAADNAAATGNRMRTVTISGIAVDQRASAETKANIEADPQAAVAASNACGSGYTISTGAWQLPGASPRYGTLYTWTNGKTTGSGYYDKPICSLFFNDSGYTRYMGVRLKSNYTADAPKEDFGAYGEYAGPVYQNRGYCGTAYAYMEDSNGKVLVDALRTVGSCD